MEICFCQPISSSTYIISKLPFKAIIHCKCLNKSWHDLLSSPYFAQLRFSKVPSKSTLLLFTNYFSPAPTPKKLIYLYDITVSANDKDKLCGVVDVKPLNFMWTIEIGYDLIDTDQRSKFSSINEDWILGNNLSKGNGYLPAPVRSNPNLSNDNLVKNCIIGVPKGCLNFRTTNKQKLTMISNLVGPDSDTWTNEIEDFDGGSQPLISTSFPSH
ncbi:unnamed protein product [Dovyalis caffra]|uniref:F-box domain-containing protein n=1 Tax=Dovyalis caffra TaxID=77055 RepID=A0AAV1RL32_9ROSI|nr:unnamed protein product [Dovyalis caffra]